ncbi:MAG: hypothetical protein K6G56_08880 [Clostridiales bacterium]|nr:hypothetical protein [Clostridiales bacterium]
MILLIAASALLSLIAFFLIVPKKTKLEASVKTVGTEIGLTFFPFFGLIGVTLRYSIGFKPGTGFFMIGPKGESKPLKAPKRSETPHVFKALKAKSISVNAEVGLDSRPDLSVLAAGSLETILDMALLAFLKIPPEVSIRPYFGGDRFELLIDGIMKLNVGKLIVEIIKTKRRKKNESSDRKHNAVLDGAHQEACRR